MQETLGVVIVILGGVVCLLILGLIGLGLLSLADIIFNKYYCRGLQDQYQIDMRRIRDRSYWFGEDKATMELIQALAEDGRDTGALRDTWRAAREKELVTSRHVSYGIPK